MEFLYVAIDFLLSFSVYYIIVFIIVIILAMIVYKVFNLEEEKRDKEKCDYEKEKKINKRGN